MDEKVLLEEADIKKEEPDDTEFIPEDLHHSIDIKEEKPILESQASEECKVQRIQPMGSGKINVVKHKRFRKKPFVCEVCDLNCITKIWLERHLKTHTGERPFMCAVCDYKSTHEKLLKEHILRDHSSEKPFSCKICNFKCVMKQDLRSHVLKVHEKPLACEICDYKTHYKGTLDMHIIRSHSAEKPFGCEICKISFSYKPDFKQHMKVHHSHNFGKTITCIKKECACGTCDYKGHVVSS